MSNFDAFVCCAPVVRGTFCCCSTNVMLLGVQFGSVLNIIVLALWSLRVAVAVYTIDAPKGDDESVP